METISLLGSALGLGLVSGVNLYATVLTVGLAIRFDLLKLAPAMADLAILASPIVLIVAGLLFVIEFVADKVPWVDSLWDAVHTLVRPLGAAAVGATAVGKMSPEMVIVGALCGGVALTGHSTKAGTRLFANHSPEPASNIVLSLIEDGFVVVGSWVALSHPYITLTLVVIFISIFIWIAPKILRLMRVEYLAAIHVLKKLYHTAKGYIQGFSARRQAALPGSNFDMEFDTVSRVNIPAYGFSNDVIPEKILLYSQDKLRAARPEVCIRCVAGKGVKKLRHSVGYLYVTDQNITFVTRRMFRLRHHEIDRQNIGAALYRKKLLLDRLTLRDHENKTFQFHFFKDSANRGEAIASILQGPMI